MTVLKVNPSFCRALIKVLPVERKKEEVSAGGIITALKSNKDLDFEQEAYTVGHVIKLGPGCFNETPDTPWFKVGDLVQFYKHSGHVVDKEAGKIDEEYFYRTVFDKDVQCVLIPAEDDSNE